MPVSILIRSAFLSEATDFPYAYFLPRSCLSVGISYFLGRRGAFLNISDVGTLSFMSKLLP